VNRKLFVSFLVVSVLVLANTGAVAQSPEPAVLQAGLGTSFTYQGELKKGATYVNGSCSFQFSLWDAVTGGTQIGSPQALDNVSVTNGRFTVPLDFGASAFAGDARYLEIAVKCAGDSQITTLTPRQALTATPYALYSSGNWGLNGNRGLSANDFFGTNDNMTLTFGVSNTVAYRIVPAVDPSNGFTPNLIGGSSTNGVAPGVYGATIGGGGTTLFPNVITGSGIYATIGGGRGNAAGGRYAAIGGGLGNTASGWGAYVGGGGYDGITNLGNQATGTASTIGGGIENIASNQYATVGGGMNNTASNWAATIGGGRSNVANNQQATVGGGFANLAGGLYATVPGGNLNVAQGDYSFAAGSQAQANHNGTFVWADSANLPFTSTASNQFLIRASGGVGINTNVPSRTLDVNGAIGVFDGGTRTYYGGLASEVNSQLVELGINDDATNRFGGAYNSAAQGGLFRVDARAGQDLFQFYGRPAGSTTSLTSLAILKASGVLYVAGGYHGTCRTDGNVSNGPICNQDVAEAFAANQLTEPGDVIALDAHDSATPTVRKANGDKNELLVGVVSTNPGLVFDNGETHLAGDNSQLITANRTVVAALGRVPVRVSLENGPIATGDPLAASSTPGAAMNATQAGQIIGYALQSSDEMQDGKLLMWLQVGEYVPAELVARMNDSSAPTQEVAALRVQVTTLQQHNSAQQEQIGALSARLATLEQAVAKDTPHSTSLPIAWPLMGGLLALGAVFAQRAWR